MPQPALEVVKYLTTPLPALREQYPPGTGGTGPRKDWSEGTLTGIQVIDGFTNQVNDCELHFDELDVELADTASSTRLVNFAKGAHRASPKPQVSKVHPGHLDHSKCLEVSFRFAEE